MTQEEKMQSLEKRVENLEKTMGTLLNMNDDNIRTILLTLDLLEKNISERYEKKETFNKIQV